MVTPEGFNKLKKSIQLNLQNKNAAKNRGPIYYPEIAIK